MYGVRLVHLLRKSCSTKINRILSPFRKTQLTSLRTRFNSPADVQTVKESDVLLFTLEKPFTFASINVLAGLQCFFWVCLGVFMREDIKRVERNSEKTRGVLAAIVKVEIKYNTPLSYLCIIFGCSVFLGTLLYTARSIRTLILHKGGRNVTIITYKLPGLSNKIKVPLSEVSGLTSRKSSKRYLALKVKDNYFYYLLDMRGELKNPPLYDVTVGVKRGF